MTAMLLRHPAKARSLPLFAENRGGLGAPPGSVRYSLDDEEVWGCEDRAEYESKWQNPRDSYPHCKRQRFAHAWGILADRVIGMVPARLSASVWRGIRCQRLA
ncbi:MAG: hypothetical protein PVF54_06865 [Anaerolineae bacterium]